ncbi:hypothetical protein ES703_05594 [subsurface metagenome]
MTKIVSSECWMVRIIFVVRPAGFEPAQQAFPETAWEA